jgi:hypothetical protein
MTRDAAINFLATHQPMPDEADLTEALIAELDEVRKYLRIHPDDAAVPLLLGIFGDGSGYGVDQLMGEAVAAHSPGVVVPALAKCLASGTPACRLWCAQIATRVPDERLVAPLAAVLSARLALQNRLSIEPEADVRELIEEVLGRP